MSAPDVPGGSPAPEVKPPEGASCSLEGKLPVSTARKVSGVALVLVSLGCAAYILFRGGDAVLAGIVALFGGFTAARVAGLLRGG